MQYAIALNYGKTMGIANSKGMPPEPQYKTTPKGEQYLRYLHEIMKITNYEQLNKLVAQSLGWKSSITFIDVDKGDYEENHEFEFYHPPGLNEEEAEDWFSEWLCICPQFSTDIDCCEEFVLAECDRRRYRAISRLQGTI